MSMRRGKDLLMYVSPDADMCALARVYFHEMGLFHGGGGEDRHWERNHVVDGLFPSSPSKG
jgi:hypothetical protein